jgi:hypothetical protein
MSLDETDRGLDDAGDRWQQVRAQRETFNRDRWHRLVASTGLWPHVLDHCQMVGRWPSIDRAALYELGQTVTTPRQAAQLYVAVAAWGAGTSALALHRAARPLTMLPDGALGDGLFDAIQRMAAAGPVEAYRRLNNAGHVHHLGPAYFTKVLHFAGYQPGAGSVQPLILDRNVARALPKAALSAQSGSRWPSGNWRTAQYDDYLTFVAGEATRRRTEPAVIEFELFQQGRQQRRLRTGHRPQPG